MAKSIVYTRPDGGVSICHPVISLDDPADFSEDDALARALASDIPHDAINPTIIDRSDVPEDRSFRDAWRHDGAAAIGHDIEKCRSIHRDRMRAARGPMLAALDVEYQRADESGDVERKRAISAKKQALRDVTKHPAIDAATSPSDLKAVWPQALT